MRDFANPYPACKPLSKKEELALVRQLRQGATQADRQSAHLKLLASITPFAFGMAKSMRWTGLQLEDLMQLAMMGADKGLKRFKPERGVRLLSYAAYWIRNSIQRGAADTAKTIRIPMQVWDIARKANIAEHQLLSAGIDPAAERIAAKLNLPLKKVLWVLEGVHQRIDSIDPLPKHSPQHSRLNRFSNRAQEFTDPSAPDPVANIDKQRLLQALQKAVAGLEPDERAVIEWRFSENKMTLQEIGLTGAEWSKKGRPLSRERIRQIESIALRKLRRILELDPTVSP